MTVSSAMEPETALAMTERHCFEGEARILRQQQLICDLQTKGHDAARAWAFLATLHDFQLVAERHRAAEIGKTRVGHEPVLAVVFSQSPDCGQFAGT